MTNKTMIQNAIKMLENIDPKTAESIQIDSMNLDDGSKSFNICVSFTAADDEPEKEKSHVFMSVKSLANADITGIKKLYKYNGEKTKHKIKLDNGDNILLNYLDTIFYDNTGVTKVKDSRGVVKYYRGLDGLTVKKTIF